jgi:drug/metabolite transporter (DMT)-like permease
VTPSSHLPRPSTHRWRPFGYAAALAAILITSAYPALTRVSVTSTLTPGDLLLFRLGMSGLLFMPYLYRHRGALTRADWASALPLSFLHGWGMAACVVFGLKFAPASHAAALGPGAIAAWIAVIGYVVFGVRIARVRVVGICTIIVGALLILGGSRPGSSVADPLAGDVLFLSASALGASYFLYLQRRRLDPVLGAALVCVTSAMLIVPWHILFAGSTIATAPLREVLWQVVVQGLVVGCVALLALNYAALTLGSQTLGVLSALVPVCGALCSLVIAGDPISPPEWTAILVISTGVAIASLPSPRQRISAPRPRGVAPLGQSTGN